MPQLVWSAPRTGTVTIEGTVRDGNPSDGSSLGVGVSIADNGLLLE